MYSLGQYNSDALFCRSVIIPILSLNLVGGYGDPVRWVYTFRSRYMIHEHMVIAGLANMW